MPRSWVFFQDIQSSLQDYVWKSALGMRSGTESMDGAQELAELEKEKEELAKKVSEMEVEKELLDMLFLLDDADQTLW